MYPPKNFLIQDQNEILSFMKQFSFATVMERERIIANLSASSNSNELKIAECMRAELAPSEKTKRSQ